MATALIIPAAGSGSRLGGQIPKQFLDLDGRPVLAHTLEAFAGLIDRAWLAVNPAWRETVETIAREAPFPCTVVAGGTTRQDSVFAALQAVDDRCDRVLVHDAVRPFVPRRCISACIAALDHHPGAVVAVPCAATVKRAIPGGTTIEATVPRDHLWLAQTPQGFTRVAGLQAFSRAAAEGFQATDDVQLLERCGMAVALVPGDARNLKITTPDDLDLAVILARAASRVASGNPASD